MLPRTWHSERLIFDKFDASEAALAQKVYNSNAHLSSRDPHFGEYPLSEFAELIAKDDTGNAQSQVQFFLRGLRHKASGKLVGYVQFELNAPTTGYGWLPMLVLHPSVQRQGLGSEAVQSLIDQVEKLNSIRRVGLNVYAENPRALRFWFTHGWRQILDVEFEEVEGETFTCVTLSRPLAAENRR